MKNQRLPDRPSELLKLAMADLDAVRADPQYHVDMAAWHIPQSNGVCAVCLAGSVMANTLGLESKNAIYGIETFEKLADEAGANGRSLAVKMVALDNIRRGYVAEAVEMMGYRVEFENPDDARRGTVFESDHQFDERMQRIVGFLEYHGL